MSDFTTCPECGQPAGQCYLICPTQDPFQGDQFAEAMDHEFNARYDDHRERYAAEAADMAREADYADEVDAEQEAYYAAALEQDTLAPDMDLYFGQFDIEAADCEELPF